MTHRLLPHSRSASGTPVRRDSHRQRKRREEEDDEDDEDEEEEDEGQRKEKSDHKDADISVFLPSGATFGELLLRSKQHHDEDESTWEGPRRRSSDGLSTVTSGPSRSRSPSPSIASSAPSVEVRSPRFFVVVNTMLYFLYEYFLGIMKHVPELNSRAL